MTVLCPFSPDNYCFVWFIPATSTDALLKSTGLQFIGPFTYLAQKCRSPTDAAASTADSDGKSSDAAASSADDVPLAIAQRFYYDPPEVMAFAWFPAQPPRHWGMYRDDPSEGVLMIVESDAQRGNTFAPMCDGLLGAVMHLVESRAKAATGGDALRILNALKRVATAGGYDVTSRVRTLGRPKAVLAHNFNGMGIVVPYDKATEVGFRPLAYNRAQLLRLLRGALSGDTAQRRSLEELRTFAHIANDECDFGNGLQLGLEFWAYDGKLTAAALEHLSMAYMLLNRGAFGDIIAAHAAARNKGMSGPYSDRESALSESSGGAGTLKRKRT